MVTEDSKVNDFTCQKNDLLNKINTQKHKNNTISFKYIFLLLQKSTVDRLASCRTDGWKVLELPFMPWLPSGRERERERQRERETES